MTTNNETDTHLDADGCPTDAYLEAITTGLTAAGLPAGCYEVDDLGAWFDVDLPDGETVQFSWRHEHKGFLDSAPAMYSWEARRYDEHSRNPSPASYYLVDNPDVDAVVDMVVQALAGQSDLHLPYSLKRAGEISLRCTCGQWKGAGSTDLDGHAVHAGGVR